MQWIFPLVIFSVAAICGADRDGYSDWSPCDPNTGLQNRELTRTCPDGYSDWRPCDPDRELQNRVHTRTCSAHRDGYSDWRPCDPDTGLQNREHTRTCPVDGGWSAWTSHGGCRINGICGTGEAYFHRRCNSPMTKNRGQPCRGRRYKTGQCTTECPVPGDWCEWGDWGPCSLTCKSRGATPISERRRNCSCPAPRHEGICPQSEDGDGATETSFGNCMDLPQCEPLVTTTTETVLGPGETLGPEIDWDYTGPSTTEATAPPEQSTLGGEWVEPPEDLL